MTACAARKAASTSPYFLRMMAGGYSNREIAEGLRLSEGVIKNHVSIVLSKFGVRDRTRAVLKGIELGYI